MKKSKSKVLSPLAQILRTALKASDLTPKQVAEESGITYSYLNVLINDTPHSVTGKTLRPRRDALKGLAKTLKIPARELLDTQGLKEEKDVVDELPQLIQRCVTMMLEMQPEAQRLSLSLVAQVYNQNRLAPPKNASVIDRIGDHSVIQIQPLEENRGRKKAG